MPFDLSAFSTEQLTTVKRDLEYRLARFQRAFFERHGRNPNEEEREPAKPAIKRYRAVCQELAKRDALATTGTHQQKGAAAKTSMNGAANGAVGEQLATQGQVLGMTGAAGAVREATRKADKEGVAAKSGEAASTAAGSGATTFLGRASGMSRGIHALSP